MWRLGTRTMPEGIQVMIFSKNFVDLMKIKKFKE